MIELPYPATWPENSICAFKQRIRDLSQRDFGRDAATVPTSLPSRKVSDEPLGWKGTRSLTIAMNNVLLQLYCQFSLVSLYGRESLCDIRDIRRDLKPRHCLITIQLIFSLRFFAPRGDYFACSPVYLQNLILNENTV